MALANSAAPPNDIKQPVHISSNPLPPSPLLSARVLQQMAHTMGFPPQGHREPGFASAEEEGSCCPVAQNHTCVWLDMSPKSLERWTGMGLLISSLSGAGFTRGHWMA